MFNQTIFGMPRCCPNRLCRHPFYQESHLGWLPKSEVEAYAIMRCAQCHDTFAIVQLMSMVHEYKERLPKEASKAEGFDGPITLSEMNRFRKKLENPNALSSLNEGRKPGASAPPDNRE